MSVRHVVAVGHEEALREARRDPSVLLSRCPDALDALALGVSSSTPVDVIVFDAQAARAEDIDRVRSACREAGLPMPIVLESGANLGAALDTMPERDPTPATPSGDTPSTPGATVADMAHALLDGRPTRALAQNDAQRALLERLDTHLGVLREGASTDATTGLPDRHALLDELDRRCALARRYRAPFTLRLEPIDEDDFAALPELTEHAEYAAIARWGLLALIEEGEREPLFGAVCPWDGLDGATLLHRAERGSDEPIRTET